MKIAEAEGTVDIQEMHNLKEKLQTLNEQLSQAHDNKQQLEKQLKLTEVRAVKTVFQLADNKPIRLNCFRSNRDV